MGTTQMATTAESTGVRRPALLREFVYIGVFYGLYWLVRNRQGTDRQATEQALTNARRVIRVEKLLGIFHEESIQKAFLGSRLFIQSLNTYYGTMHFIVTIGALLWCFRYLPGRYPSIRNGLAVMTGLALFGFAFFPLMPPRLMPSPPWHFVDTLNDFGGPWSFHSGPISKVSNQFAAMPSLHFGWSSWCAITFWPWAKNLGRKVILLAYPLLTLFAIVVTANHWFLDAVGGFVVFALGMWLGQKLTDSGFPERLRHWLRLGPRAG
jgi:PAP2 superfamily